MLNVSSYTLATKNGGAAPRDVPGCCTSRMSHVEIGLEGEKARLRQRTSLWRLGRHLTSDPRTFRVMATANTVILASHAQDDALRYGDFANRQCMAVSVVFGAYSTRSSAAPSRRTPALLDRIIE